MDTITLLVVIFIASIFIILISVLLIWIIHDLNRIKRIKRFHNNSKHHHHYHHNQNDSLPLAYFSNSSSNPVNQTKNISLKFEKKPSIIEKKKDHQKIIMSNNDINSFKSYIKPCDNDNKNSQDEQLKSIKTIGTLPRDQRKLRTFLLTFNNHHDRNSCNDFQNLNDDNESYECDSFSDECLLLNSSSSNDSLSITSRPIPVERFLQVYQSKIKDSDLGYSREFIILENVCKRNLYTKIELAERRPVNKDRFQNVVPYKHSMVRLSSNLFKNDNDLDDLSPDLEKPLSSKLEEEKDDDNTYINASFIPGYHYQREYIATLEPWNLNSMDNFFRMILQYQISTIVNLVEYECISYFPKWTNDEPIRRCICGRWLIVKLKEHVVENNYQIKHVQFIDEDQNKILHQVNHFHFTSWKDFSCPEQEESLLKFIEIVRSFHNRHVPESLECSERPPPMLVHCRAGIGRTGTYIAIDQLWQRLNYEFLQTEMPRKDIWQKLFNYYETKYLLEQKNKRNLQSTLPNNIVDNKKTQTSSLKQSGSSSSANKFFEQRKFQTISGFFRGSTSKIFKNINDIETVDDNGVLTFNQLSPSQQQQPQQQQKPASKPPKKYSIDIYGLIFQMRSNRMGMVQTESQYAYIHKCVKHILQNWKCIQINDDLDVDVDYKSNGDLKSVLIDSGGVSKSNNNEDKENYPQHGNNSSDFFQCQPNSYTSSTSSSATLSSGPMTQPTTNHLHLHQNHQSHLRPLSTIIEERTPPTTPRTLTPQPDLQATNSTNIILD